MMKLLRMHIRSSFFSLLKQQLLKDFLREEMTDMHGAKGEIGHKNIESSLLHHAH